jgi:regulator of cell morphogenesis and NO signaling
MARLETQVEEAALLEGRRHPVLMELREEVARFCADLRAHLKAEERMLFPALLDLGQGRVPAAPGDLLEPLKLLEDEHEAAGGLLKRMRSLTEGFTPPPGARASQRKLYETLQALADSLYRHLYLENQVLFRRVRAVKG